jgi:hypothetical protein
MIQLPFDPVHCVPDEDAFDAAQWPHEVEEAGLTIVPVPDDQAWLYREPSCPFCAGGTCRKLLICEPGCTPICLHGTWRQ